VSPSTFGDPLIGSAVRLPMTGTDRFWTWFEQNIQQIQADVSAAHVLAPSALITDGIGNMLAESHPGLVHEIGQSDDGVFEIIISADGIRERFPRVAECVRNAPRLAAWRIIAFRPRRDPPQSVNFSGVQFSHSDFLYLPSRDGDRISIEILYRGDLPVKDQRVIAASFLFLDFALGEFDVEMRIGSIGRRSLPANFPTPSNGVSLGQLVSMIDDWFPYRGRFQ
jgi:hypothetical protein